MRETSLQEVKKMLEESILLANDLYMYTPEDIGFGISRVQKSLAKLNAAIGGLKDGEQGKDISL